MGTVTLVRDRCIGRFVAMKELHEAGALDEDLQRRFLREARVQGRLEHPSIVPVYDLSRRADGRIVFSMRAVGGQTLAEVNDMPRHRLLAAFTRICLAVDYAHESGVVHRDLKPENIMFGDFGEVYVLDWGIAKRIDRRADVAAVTVTEERVKQLVWDDESGMIGTPGYMAPEQLVDQELVGPWSDIYTLGCILFEMVTGEPLNGSGSVSDRIFATLSNERIGRADMPPELARICKRSTSFDPASRHHSARKLHDEVDAYLGGERDAMLRRMESADHARRAAERLRERDGAEERSEAMKHLGRALALDPKNDAALVMFMRMLARPPKELPKDAHPATDAERRKGFRRAALYSLGVHACFLVLSLLLMWATRLNWWLGAMAGAALASMGLSWAIWRGRDSEQMVVYMMLTSTACLAFVSGTFGPLLVAPLMVAVNVCVYCTLLRKRARTLCLAAGMVALAVPCGLELFGATESYAFGASGLLIRSGTPLAAAPTIAFLVLAALGAILGGGVSCSFVREALEVAERKLRVQAWHLRQALPGLERDRGV
jgi:serine/threonine-protein kinase